MNFIKPHKPLTQKEFLELGLEEILYARPVTHNELSVVIHEANKGNFLNKSHLSNEKMEDLYIIFNASGNYVALASLKSLDGFITNNQDLQTNLVQ